MSNDYFDFLNQNSQQEQPAQEEPKELSVNLTTRADVECQVVCDGDFLFLLPPNQIIKEKAPVGQHILQFISTEHPDIVVEKVVDFPEAGKNYLVLVSEFKTLIAEKEKPVEIDYISKLGSKGTYTGQVKDGKPDGRGKVVFASGSVYEGEFHSGWRHGKGVMSFAKGDKYEGDFYEDLQTGHGIYTYKNGDKFEGEYVNGIIQNKPHIYIWANGDRLECEGWENGSNGKGTYYYKDGRKEESIWHQGLDIRKISFEGYLIQPVIGGRVKLDSDRSDEDLSKGIKNEIIPAAEMNNASAQFILGVAYAEGRGVPHDPILAVQWYKRAAENGHATAQAYYAFALRWGKNVKKNYAEAKSWCRKAAEQGDCYAQCLLGDLYYFSENGMWNINSPADMASAFYWYKKAADQGDPYAQFNVGKCFYDGHGTPKNHVEALKWLHMSAEQNIVGAQVKLANLYDFYIKDLKKAIIWYQRAAEQGNEDAKRALQRLGIK